jgi:hypothetical protein
VGVRALSGARADVVLATDPDTTVGMLPGRLRPEELDPGRRAGSAAATMPCAG